MRTGDGRTYEKVRYDFQPDELQALGEQLAAAAQTVFSLREQKAAFDAKLNGDIKEANALVARIAELVSQRFEMRETEVLILLDDPKPGQKRIVRVDNNETVRFAQMTQAEMQSSFGFGE